MRAEYFWRDAYQKEVDVVVPGPSRAKPPAPIEVKYGAIETRGMAAFMRKHKVARGWIVSNEREEVLRVDGGRVDVVPAHLFLLRPPVRRER
jgi:predicted AAA+ superfamily ATPase